MFKRWVLAVLLALSAFAAAADESSVQRLRRFLAKAGTMEAEFSQVQMDDKGNPGKRASGKFYLKRPGKFRWDYTQPYRQEIVSSGGKVWFYDVDLEQVTAKKLNEAIGSTPALLLSGEVPIEANFNIEKQGFDDGIHWLKLLPKAEESGFRYVMIGLEGDVLAGMELGDNFGQTTRIYFQKVKLGGRSDAKLFEFHPPAGVDVFEDK